MQSVRYQFVSFPDFFVEITLAPYFSMISRAIDSASAEYSVMPRSRKVFAISRSISSRSFINSGGRDENGTGFGSGRE